MRSSFLIRVFRQEARWGGERPPSCLAESQSAGLAKHPTGGMALLTETSVLHSKGQFPLAQWELKDIHNTSASLHSFDKKKKKGGKRSVSFSEQLILWSICNWLWSAWEIEGKGQKDKCQKQAAATLERELSTTWIKYRNCFKSTRYQEVTLGTVNSFSHSFKQE